MTTNSTDTAFFKKALSVEFLANNAKDKDTPSRKNGDNSNWPGEPSDDFQPSSKRFYHLHLQAPVKL